MTDPHYNINYALTCCEAAVLSCEAGADGMYVLQLERTVLFPGGGGQKADEGWLNGVPCRAGEQEGRTVHLCSRPFAPGEQVSVALDTETRLRRSRSHTAEHIVTGLAHRNFGCVNVGFHMDEALVTFDLSRELTAEQVEFLEREANRTVLENRPVRAFFPTEEELSALPYRSKGELSGPVRLVEIEGCDFCACCAPHVQRTGEIGRILLTGAVRHRGGMRLTMLTGMDAYEETARRFKNMDALSALFSVPPEDVTAAAEKVLAKVEALEKALAAEKAAGLLRLAESAAPTDGALCFFPGETDGDSLRALVNECMDRCRVCAAFAGQDGALRYVIGSRQVDLRAAAKEINAAIGGRGGGSSTMIQGSCTAPQDTIEAYFRKEF